MQEEIQRPKVGLGVIIKRQGKILLGKRFGSHGAETWSLPGGHLEFFETLEECAKRELKEETNLETEEFEFLTITNDFFKEENKHYITIYMINKTPIKNEPKLMEPHKCRGWQWFDLNNLPKPLFIPIQNLLNQGSLKNDIM